MPVTLVTIQFLAWVADRPRTYAEVAEAWRSTCPATCAWEDALSDGLVGFAAGGRLDRSEIVLTARGRAALAGAVAAECQAVQAAPSNRSTTASSSAR